MDSRVNFKEFFEKCCIPPTDDAERAGYHGFISDNYVYNTNDRATLLSNYLMNGECLCSHLSQQFKTNRSSFKPWIAFLHILCSGILALFGMALTSNILVFEKKSIEMDYVTWRSLPISLTTILPTSQDKCEPLYVLIYAHCLLWFLFLVLDHVARYLLQKTLRLRGHLRVFQRLNRLAAIPFQLVSFWTVMLAIFIAVYAQQDNADMEPYCDANLLISPKNGIATLLVLEFISVTISSLIYGNAIRKFSLEKPQSDVYGWEENYSNRWTSQALQQNNNPSVSQCPNTENFPTHHYETKCLLDLLEYYTHANKELASKLGHASLKLRQLEEEKYPQPSEL